MANFKESTLTQLVRWLYSSKPFTWKSFPCKLYLPVSPSYSLRFASKSYIINEGPELFGKWKKHLTALLRNDIYERRNSLAICTRRSRPSLLELPAPDVPDREGAIFYARPIPRKWLPRIRFVVIEWLDNDTFFKNFLRDLLPRKSNNLPYAFLLAQRNFASEFITKKKK